MRLSMAVPGGRMRKMIKPLIVIILGLVIVAAAAFTALYFTRFQSIATLEKLTDYDDGYNLYTMTVKYDYSVQDIIDSGIEDTQDYLSAVVKESLPLLPIYVELPSFGCSAYRAVNTEGEAIMGRNYDFKYDTSCLALICQPKDGYKSISFAALNNLNADAPEQSLTQKMTCLVAPFAILDGINEKGVSMAVLTLDSEPTVQDTGKKKITTALAIRLVLDGAATTQEAIDLLTEYDMLASNGRDYHFFISDANGDSRVVEYDCDNPSRPMVVTSMDAITNFYGMYIDRVEANQKNGLYGHGKERYEAMKEIIDANDGVLDEDQAWSALMAASQEPNPESITSNTQWCILFNNDKGTADITLRRHWGDKFTFNI